MRGGMEFAGVNIGVFVEAENDRHTCKGARITVGAISGGPQRASAVEAFLEGKDLTEDTITAASRKITEDIKIVPHHGYTKGYLTECLKSQAKTALTDATNAIIGAT